MEFQLGNNLAFVIQVQDHTSHNPTSFNDLCYPLLLKKSYAVYDPSQQNQIDCAWRRHLVLSL